VPFLSERGKELSHLFGTCRSARFPQVNGHFGLTGYYRRTPSFPSAAASPWHESNGQD
jgi:hypothetical protein